MTLKENAPIAGQTIKQARFRTLFDAAVVDIRRDLRRVPGNLSDVVLKNGDELMLDAGINFSMLAADVKANFINVEPIKAPAKQFLMALEVEAVCLLLLVTA